MQTSEAVLTQARAALAHVPYQGHVLHPTIQLRLSDGTLLFSPDPFDTGGTISRASYSMLDLDAGVKYRGWSFDAEYYFRWLTDFKLIRGTIPVSSLYDHPVHQILHN